MVRNQVELNFPALSPRMVKEAKSQRWPDKRSLAEQLLRAIRLAIVCDSQVSNCRQDLQLTHLALDA